MPSAERVVPSELVYDFGPDSAASHFDRDRGIADRRIRDVANVILSNVLRDVSLQDPADLRIRRRSNPQGTIRQSLNSSIFCDSERRMSWRQQECSHGSGSAEGNAWRFTTGFAGLSASFDAVITVLRMRLHFRT